MHEITIVIPVFNQAYLTERCLNSLLENSKYTNELIVINNNSSDNTSEVLKNFEIQFSRHSWKMSVITNQGNVGFGRAINQGVKACNKKYVAILNNDIWLMPKWDQVLLTRLTELGADMIGPYYDETPFDPIETPKEAQTFIERNAGKCNKNWVSILMFFKRELFHSIGEFDERFFVTYEDTDFRERMDRAGKKYFQVGDCYIWHLSKGTRNTQNLPTNYEQEGLRLFIDKWKFDPRIREQGFDARLKRRWSKIKNKMGYF